MRTIEHWIAGKTTAGSVDRTAAVFNPATGQQQAEVLPGLGGATSTGRDLRRQGRVRRVVADLR